MKSKLPKLFRSLDDYGHPIRVTYKGEETYQTYCGACFSFIVQALTLYFILAAI